MSRIPTTPVASAAETPNASHGHAHNTHAHRHAPAAPGGPTSPLRHSAGDRLLGAALVLAALWASVFWALS